MIKTYTGKCSHFPGTQSIRVEYQHIPMIQTLKHNYKRIGFTCNHECSDRNNCPIYKNVPKSIIE